MRRPFPHHRLIPVVLTLLACRGGGADDPALSGADGASAGTSDGTSASAEGAADAPGSSTDETAAASDEMDGPLLDVAPGTTGGQGSPGCLSDLQTIVDEHGVVVGQCPDDQGCLDGECVEPCAAAAGSQSTIGCEYFAVPYGQAEGYPDAIGFRGACFAVLVVNNWPTPVVIDVARGDDDLDVAMFGRLVGDVGGTISYDPLPADGLPPGEVAVLFLSKDVSNDDAMSVGCPTANAVAITEDTAIHVSGIGEAFRIETDRPVTMVQVYPWGGASSFFPSAATLIPATAWGENYVLPGVGEQHHTMVATASGVVSTRPFDVFVAQRDATTVTVLPTRAIEDGPGIVGGPADVPIAYTLDAGEYLQIIQPAGLAGSVVQSDGPIGTFVGSEMFIYELASDGDATGQMVPPVNALAHAYVGAPYQLPVGGQTGWQLIGAVDGTELQWDPAPPPGAPETLSLGEVVELEAGPDFSVRSQDADHPFVLVGYRDGRHGPNSSNGPDYVVATPPAQYLDRYVFVTDPTYERTELVFVRLENADGFADVELDCAGTIVGWTALGDDGDYEVARVVFGEGNGCTNGRREATSALPFGITVWGMGFAASYGYPAGGNFQPINDILVPAG